MKFMRNSTEKPKPAPAPRGRPRSFDEAEVLERVRAVFLEKGFSGASLDELAAAAKLNRPSLYAAFGDKEGLYLHALKHYGAQSVAAMEEILARKLPIAQRLGQIYKAAVAFYTATPRAPGCMIVNTAAVEAPTHPRIGAAAAELIAELEAALERAFARAVAEGELAPVPSPAGRARLAAAMFDTLAVRARLGESAANLKAFGLSMVPGICAGLSENGVEPPRG
jgi:AcrR family transcriptional regulator